MPPEWLKRQQWIQNNNNEINNGNHKWMEYGNGYSFVIDQSP